MDEEKEEMGLESTIPDGYKWKDLVNLNGRLKFENLLQNGLEEEMM